MASITGKPTIFFVTSPRSPYKMRDEVDFLVKNYSGQRWSGNPQLQASFYSELSKTEFFIGTASGDLAFKARDRITRAPKSLGLVNLDPVIELTEAGHAYLYGKRPQEVFTRQLLKFQLPSPYHKDVNNDFCVRPYLELLRLVLELDGISKDEIAIYVMQLTNIDKYEEIKSKILNFRQRSSELDHQNINYKNFLYQEFNTELFTTYSEQLSTGATATRESDDDSLEKFIATKRRNHIDYADAAIRYLRETELVTLRSNRSNVIIIPEDRRDEVEFILATVPRLPQFLHDEKAYKEYLFDSHVPELLVDDRDALIKVIRSHSVETQIQNLEKLPIDTLKDVRDKILENKLNQVIYEEITHLQTYENVQDILETYEAIRRRQVIDPSLIMEWNTWRAFVVLDDGTINGNFKLNYLGDPISTAPGNKPDILCRYDDYDLLVEVTLSSGATQYEMEGEPIPRHLGQHINSSGRKAYCIFIAPSLNRYTIAHFFVLHRTPVVQYGGTARIIPLSLDDFLRMLRKASEAVKKPTAATIKKFVVAASNRALEAPDEQHWYNDIRNLIDHWI